MNKEQLEKEIDLLCNLINHYEKYRINEHQQTCLSAIRERFLVACNEVLEIERYENE